MRFLNKTYFLTQKVLTMANDVLHGMCVLQAVQTMCPRERVVVGWLAVSGYKEET